jgi:hypothetical protein
MSSSIKWAARIGYAGRGFVYLAIGFLAILAAFGRAQAEGTGGALEWLLGQPFGAVLVGGIAVGFVCISGWRILQALRDTDNHGKGAKGIAIRAGLALGGISYAAAAVLATALVAGWGAGGVGGDASGRWLAALDSVGLAAIAIYAAAAILAAVGVAHVIKGVRSGFEKYLEADAGTMRWLRPVARFGLVARGAVFLIVAALAVSGGLAYRAEEQPGLADALRAVQDLPFGWLLLLLLACGLVGFGAYSLAEARYRRISPR